MIQIHIGCEKFWVPLIDSVSDTAHYKFDRFLWDPGHDLLQAGFIEIIKKSVNDAINA